MKAMLCVGGCKALRESWTELAQKSLSYSGYDKRGKDSPYGALSPQEISIEPLYQKRFERALSLRSLRLCESFFSQMFIA